MIFLVMKIEAVADWLLELPGVFASPRGHMGLSLVLIDSLLVRIQRS